MYWPNKLGGTFRHLFFKQMAIHNIDLQFWTHWFMKCMYRSMVSMVLLGPWPAGHGAIFSIGRHPSKEQMKNNSGVIIYLYNSDYNVKIIDNYIYIYTYYNLNFMYICNVKLVLIGINNTHSTNQPQPLPFFFCNLKTAGPPQLTHRLINQPALWKSYFFTLTFLIVLIIEI